MYTEFYFDSHIGIIQLGNLGVDRTIISKQLFMVQVGLNWARIGCSSQLMKRL